MASPGLMRLSPALRILISPAASRCQVHDTFFDCAVLITRRLQSPCSILFRSTVIK